MKNTIATVGLVVICLSSYSQKLQENYFGILNPAELSYSNSGWPIEIGNDSIMMLRSDRHSIINTKGEILHVEEKGIITSKSHSGDAEDIFIGGTKGVSGTSHGMVSKYSTKTLDMEWETLLGGDYGGYGVWALYDDDSHVYAVGNSEVFKFYACKLDAGTGDVLWKTALPNDSITTTGTFKDVIKLSDGSFVATGGLFKSQAVNFNSNGDIIWTYNSDSLFYSHFVSSTSVENTKDNTLIIAHHAYLITLDLATGNELDKLYTGVTYNQVFIKDEKLVLFGFDNPNLYSPGVEGAMVELRNLQMDSLDRIVHKENLTWGHDDANSFYTALALSDGTYFAAAAMKDTTLLPLGLSSSFYGHYTVLSKTPDAVSQINNGLQSEVYPNPCLSTLFLPIETDYQIFNLQGKVLLEGFGISIDVSSLTPGTYTIFDGLHSKLFIKK